ncbi:MAG: SUMF1/EgtB/PvdO family nonheme iron enzyme [Chloroflexi bacterium]|nr:SUMF1/EgtB/PvdO family nonheme iron enzyme [Chloroflexota bacterium]
MDSEPNSIDEALAQLERAIAGQEAALGLLPAEQQAAAGAILVALRERQTQLLAQAQGSGAAAQGVGNVAIGERGTQARDVGGDVVTGKKTVVYAAEGAKVVIGDETPEEMSAVQRESALGRYLAHVIAHNRYLQLQGIRSGGRLVHIELEQIYVTLRATQQRTAQAEEAWLAQEAGLAPGERRRTAPVPPGNDARPAGPHPSGRQETGDASVVTETATVSLNEALRSHRRLVVLGDPGSGKTTLLRYLALVYARDLAGRSGLVKEKLGLAESGALPILLPLRQIGAFLQSQSEESTEGHALLLRFLHQYLQNERIDVPLDFFDSYLEGGRAVILLDGLDEVAGSDLRRRVARLVESFSRAYAGCRYLVTSRIVGYSGPVRLGEEYVTTTVRDFTLGDVAQFLTYWHRLVAAGQLGPGATAEAYAADQTRQLMAAIQGNERVRELAINPLMLTVIALVHRDRVKLPDRRAELYAEAVDVLLGKWDEARGVTERPVLEGKPFDTGDRRLMLQALALHLHQARLKEIEADALRRLLFGLFRDMAGDDRGAERAVTRFLEVIEERTGLLAARGEGVYAFSHLTFQEYLAALAVAARDDYLAYTLARSGDSWWREVILLEAGYLSTQSKERTTRLIQALAGRKEEPEPYYNLVLAAECLQDIGSNRVKGNLASEIRQRLQTELETSPKEGFLGARQLFMRDMTPRGVTERRIAAATALARIGGHKSQFWTQSYGEPEWVRIPAAEFVMGSNLAHEHEKPQHRVYLEDFEIAPAPIANIQYFYFTQATGHKPPNHWEDWHPPKYLESHPVTEVTWYDAMAYCRWLSEVTGKTVTLPSEAEWEKAARGHNDSRVYPWGDTYDPMRCNGDELGIGATTPVGIFPDGTSPYGVLDMIGNVWEWTRSLYGKRNDKKRTLAFAYKYPYEVGDGREDLSKGDQWLRVMRGGSWFSRRTWLHCASRFQHAPDYGGDAIGFRVVAFVCS